MFKKAMRFIGFCSEPDRLNACINCPNFDLCQDKMDEFNNDEEFKSIREKFYEGQWFIVEAMDNEGRQTYTLTYNYHHYEELTEDKDGKFEDVCGFGPFEDANEALTYLKGLILDEWD